MNSIAKGKPFNVTGTGEADSATQILEGLRVAIDMEQAAVDTAQKAGQRPRGLRGRWQGMTPVERERVVQLVWHIKHTSPNELCRRIGVNPRASSDAMTSRPLVHGAWDGDALDASTHYAAAALRRPVDGTWVPLWFMFDETKLREVMAAMRTQSGLKVVGLKFNMEDNGKDMLLDLATAPAGAIATATNTFDVIAKRADCCREGAT